MGVKGRVESRWLSGVGLRLGGSLGWSFVVMGVKSMVSLERELGVSLREFES